MKVGVTGHQELPGPVDAFVRRVVGARFANLAGLVVVSSLAAGADQLIAGLAVRHGGELDVVIPCQGYEETFDGPVRDEYLKLVAQAREVETLPFPAPGEDAFMAAGQRVVDRCDELLAVWDGLPARGHGGTSDVVSYAADRHVPVTVVWPEDALRAPAQ